MLERLPTPLRAIARTLTDWWGELYVLSLANFFWLLLMFPIITAPAATAALFTVGWQTARHEGTSVREFFAAFRSCFISSLPLGLLTMLGSAFVGFDLFYYVMLLNGGLLRLDSLVTWTAFYMLIIWMQFLGYCWAHFAARPDVGFGGTLKNAAILTFRFSGYNLIISLFALLLLGLSIVPLLPIFVTFAISALIMAESLLEVAPELVGHRADWVPPEQRVDTWK
jgi:uncharacterized membrane protein YesL